MKLVNFPMIHSLNINVKEGEEEFVKEQLSINLLLCVTVFLTSLCTRFSVRNAVSCIKTYDRSGLYLATSDDKYRLDCIL